MEEIKELINLINQLPHLAMWVLVGFWAYKVIVVGSIYGLIKFVVTNIVRLFNKGAEEVTYLQVGGHFMSEAAFDHLLFKLKMVGGRVWITESCIDKLFENKTKE